MTNTEDGTRYKSTSFRAETSLVEGARKIFDAHDLSMSAAITLFLEACVREGRIPEAILNPGSMSANGDFVDTVLRSVTEQLNLPDYGNPWIPSDVFANEIMLEFTDSIFCDCFEPWFDMAHAVLDMSSLEQKFIDDGGEEDAWYWYGIEYLEDFIPEKLPYDYALKIVEAETKAWAKAEQDVKIEMDSPYDTMMGKILKRSHLTLDGLMEMLVEAGAVEEKDGDNYNRSMGRMVENLVAHLKENRCWDAPEPMNGIPFKEVRKGLIDETIDGDVAFRVGCDCTRLLAHEHPIDLLFQDAAVSMNQAIESTYTSLFYIDELDALDLDVDWLELDDTLLFMFDNCKFKFPPKSVYDECVRRYLDAMENAEPGTMAAKCLPYAKAPFDYENAFLYPIAIDMDTDVWAEVYNREAFFTTVKAVEDGVLPDLRSLSHA